MRHYTFAAKFFLSTWVCASGLVFAQTKGDLVSPGRDVYHNNSAAGSSDKEDAPKVEFTSRVSFKKGEYQLPAGETSNNLVRHMIDHSFQATEVGANSGGTNFGTYAGFVKCDVLRDGAAVTSSNCVVSKEPPVGFSCSTGAVQGVTDHSNVEPTLLPRRGVSGNVQSMPSTGGVPRKKN
ncbi:MAG TPA: hypothetical protein VM901_01065 [Bdellovibrionota bacterium]|jgi:hypothetical protein|nr:hypothetical protein [Bdellovibrionota bacterium]